MASSQENPVEKGGQTAKTKGVCRLCREAGGTCVTGYRKTHDRSDPLCRLFGVLGGGKERLHVRPLPQQKAKNQAGDRPSTSRKGDTERQVKKKEKMRRWTGTALRGRLRQILHVKPVWGDRPLRWSPRRGRHYDEALERYHTDAEEAQLQREHAERVQSKELYGKANETLRFLRANGGQPTKFLDKVAKDTAWVDKIHDACWRKWGNQPPRGGGSEEYSDEILDLSTPEWLNTEDGEWVPTTPTR